MLDRSDLGDGGTAIGSWDVVARRELGRTAWDGFAVQCDEAWLWHRYDVAAVEAVDASFALVGPDGEPVAIVPLHKVVGNRRGIRRPSSLYSAGGPATRQASPDLLRAIRHHALAAGVTHHVASVNLSISPMTPSLRHRSNPPHPLAAMGAGIQVGQSWVVDLRDGIDRVWEQMNQRARRGVRKAERCGVTVRPANAADLDLTYQLHVETCRRTGIRPQRRSYFSTTWERLIPAGVVRAFVGELDGAPVGVQTFGAWKGGACYWTGSSTAAALECGANHLLQWAAMQWMASNEIALYDLGEAFPDATGKLRGISDFKQNFGGELQDYFWCWLDTAGRLRRTLRGARTLIRGSRTKT